jgi:hypothetical protein
VRSLSAAACLVACIAIAGCGSERADGDAARASTDTHSASAAPASSAPELSGSATEDCDAAAISRDLGVNQTVERCYGDWAYVDAGGLGDSSALARLVNGRWTSYTAFPTAICKAAARADGVPERELANFTTC